jgi:hypothetical protein
MKPIDFPEKTLDLQKPAGMTDEQCSPLPVFRDGQHCISCWAPTWRERLEILLGRPIWLWVWMGNTQPPVLLATERPFVKRMGRRELERALRPTWRERVWRLTGWSLLLALLAAPALAQEPAPAATPAPLAAATYAELSATSTQVTGRGAEAQNYIGSQLLAQAGFGHWAVNIRARWEGLPGEFKGDQYATYRSVEAYLSAHVNLFRVEGVVCGPAATIGYAVGLDAGKPTFSHDMTGLFGLHCSDGRKTFLAQLGSWTPLPGWSGTFALIWPISEHISMHGDYGVGARQQWVAKAAVAIMVKRWVRK